jgi:hypothetical protein
MRPFLARLSEPVWSGHAPSWADFITTTPDLKFSVHKGSEAAFEQVWMSRDSHLEKVPGFVEFHLLRGREARFMPLTPSGKAVLCLKRGPNRRRSVPRIGGQGTTSRCIWITRSLKGFEVRQTVGRVKSV